MTMNAMTADDVRPSQILRHGAYICLRLAEGGARAAAAAAVPALVERLRLANEFDVRDGHPPEAVAFLRRLGATPGPRADDGLLHAHAVVHVAAATESPVAEFCAELARLLGPAARTQVLGGVVRPMLYTGNLDAQLRLRAPGHPAAGAGHAERVPGADEQDRGVVGQGLDGAAHVLPAPLRRCGADGQRGPRARVRGRSAVPAAPDVQVPGGARARRRLRLRRRTSSARTPTSRRSTRCAPRSATCGGTRSGPSCARAPRGTAGAWRRGATCSRDRGCRDAGPAAWRPALPRRRYTRGRHRDPVRTTPGAGGVAERLKAPVLKTGIPQGIGGSNPSPSANLGPGRAAAGRPGPLAVYSREPSGCGLARCSRASEPSGYGKAWRGGRVGRRQPPAKRLQGQNLCPGFESRPLRHAPIAQMDRASDYESEGQRFDSSWAHHLSG